MVPLLKRVALCERGTEAPSYMAQCMKPVLFTFIATQHSTHYAEPFSHICTETGSTM